MENGRRQGEDAVTPAATPVTVVALEVLFP